MPSPSDATPSPSEMLKAISEKWEELDLLSQGAVYGMVHAWAVKPEKPKKLEQPPTAEDLEELVLRAGRAVLETRRARGWWPWPPKNPNECELFGKCP